MSISFDFDTRKTDHAFDSDRVVFSDQWKLETLQMIPKQSKIKAVVRF